MTNQTLNWGLLSTARINRALIPPLQVSKRNHLLAVGSRAQETAEAYAREKKIERAYGSYAALLADPDIDVIYNPLPNHLHAEWTIKAVEAGKHVLCEKPLALTTAEVEAIHAAARANGRVVAEAFMYRHHAQTLKVQELVRSGVLGVIRLIRGSFSFVLAREGDVRLNPEWGGGSLWDVGCYPVSYTRSALGEEPVEVFGWQATGETGVDVSFSGQMLFASGVHAQFFSSFVTPLHSFMEIVGTEGTLNIPHPFKPGPDEKIYLTRDEHTETIKVKGQELYLGEVEDMADVVLLGRAPRISLADSQANVAALVALLESARTGRAIRL